MVQVTCPPKHSDSPLADRVSSLGTLDCLPPEIMSMLLGMLDIQSVVRFASVSFQGNTLAQSLHAYQNLVIIIPQVILALRRLDLIALHPIAQIYATLRTECCAICAQYGAFLFLPTCQRCCWQCLQQSSSLRLILCNEAERYFSLSKRHMKQLPTISAIPGNYSLSDRPARENCKLVAAKAARELGLEVHGSAERLATALARRCKSARNLVVGRYLQGEPVIAKGQDSLLLPSQGNIPPDSFFGMASLPFPSLSSSHQLENGLWCRGCEFTHRQYSSLRLPRDVMATIVPPDHEPRRVLLGLQRRAWSKEGLLEHIRHCYGAQQLTPEMEA